MTLQIVGLQTESPRRYVSFEIALWLSLVFWSGLTINSIYVVKQAKKADEAEIGLKLGEPLPDLVLKNEQGEEVKVENLAEDKKGVVLFLVPKADTRMFLSFTSCFLYFAGI